jgi:hypothetical protein
MDRYRLDLALCWTIRFMLALSLIAIVAITGGCTHNLKLSTDSSGSLHRDPPVVVDPPISGG